MLHAYSHRSSQGSPKHHSNGPAAEIIHASCCSRAARTAQLCACAMLSTCLQIVVACLLTQMNYLNKSLDLFNTAIVSPIYYVMFTLLTIIASVIMFQVGSGASALGRHQAFCHVRVSESQHPSQCVWWGPAVLPWVAGTLLAQQVMPNCPCDWCAHLTQRRQPLAWLSFLPLLHCCPAG